MDNSYKIENTLLLFGIPPADKIIILALNLNG